MIRLVLFLLGILALVVGLHWLADRPGTITIEWLGYIAETSMFRALVILAIVLARGARGMVAPAAGLAQPRDRGPLSLPPPPEARARCADRAASSPSAPATGRSPSATRRRPARRCRTSRSRICCARRPPRSAAIAPPRGASSRPCWPRPRPSSSACAACSWRRSARASTRPRGSSPSGRCSATPSSAGRWRRCSICNAAPRTGRLRSTRSTSPAPASRRQGARPAPPRACC